MRGMSTHTADELSRDPLPLRGRSAVVTGASRRRGIGYAIACRLAAYGASVFCHHYSPHDAEQPWGAEDVDGALGELDASMLDRHWAVNARASILLAQAFAARHEEGDPASIVFMTSGQGQGPMPGEVAYAASKAALAGITTTIADELADHGIRVNTINPGPVDTGYMTDEARRSLLPMFPLGRLAEPDDPARLIAWLTTDEAGWITGQVIHSEGGFARWRPQAQDG
jgi:3-oxoacyl-[acyl-carrier protein] reductase